MYSTNTGLPNVVVYSNKKKLELDLYKYKKTFFIKAVYNKSILYICDGKTSKSIYVTMAWPPQVDV